MVKVGMKFMDVILFVIVVLVKILGILDWLGIIEGGKLVDIIVMNGNLIEDIFVVIDVSFVMKNGKIFK